MTDLTPAQRRALHLATARKYARQARRYGKKTAEHVEALRMRDAHLERARVLESHIEAAQPSCCGG